MYMYINKYINMYFYEFKTQFFKSLFPFFNNLTKTNCYTTSINNIKQLLKLHHFCKIYSIVNFSDITVENNKYIISFLSINKKHSLLKLCRNTVLHLKNYLYVKYKIELHHVLKCYI